MEGNQSASLRNCSLDRANSRLYWFLLATVVLVSALLRFYDLGRLGVRWDEDISALAVRGILKYGYPLFPSGMIHIRSGAFLYLMAASVNIFGFDELGLRIPSALFGVAWVPLSYWFGTLLGNRRIGLFVAVCVAISPWAIDLTRNARMYAPFGFSYLASLLAIYICYIQGKSRLMLRMTVIALAMVTIMLHSLGFTLGAILVAVAFLSDRSLQDRLWLIASATIIAAFFFLWSDFINSLFSIPFTAGEAVHSANSFASQSGYSIFGIVISTLNTIEMPPAKIFAVFWSNSLLFRVLISGLVLLIVAWLIASMLRQRRAITVATATIALSCIFQQFGIAMVALAAYMYLYGEGIGFLRYKQNWLLVTFIVLMGGFWFSFGMLFMPPNEFVLSGESSQWRQVIRSLIDFPNFGFTFGYFKQRPFLSCLMLIGTVAALDRTSRTSDRSALFVVYALFVPLLLHGLTDRRPDFRYNLHLEPVFFTLVAYGIVALGLVASRVWKAVSGKANNRRIAYSGIAVMLVGIFVTDLSPLRAWSVADRVYTDHLNFFSRYEVQAYPDHRSSGCFVRSQLAAKDIVIATDWIAQDFYVGRVDYVLRGKQFRQWSYFDGTWWRDGYLGSRVIYELEMLKEVLQSNRNSRVWVIIDKLSYHDLLGEHLRLFVDSQAENIVQTAEDGVGRVLLFHDGDNTEFEWPDEQKIQNAPFCRRAVISAGAPSPLN